MNKRFRQNIRQSRSFAGFGLAFLLLIGLFAVLGGSGLGGAASATGLAGSAQKVWMVARPVTETANLLFLPAIVRSDSQPTSTPTPTLAPEPDREWDPRLDQRFTELRPATVAPGQGYWRLVKAVWFNEAESGGRHHILMDVLDTEGTRVVGLQMRVYWSSGQTLPLTEEKPGESWATNFAMNDFAPSYGALPNDGSPADEVWGMGYGSIEQPNFSIHTSYGLTWQWTIAGGATPTPTGTATPTVTPTPPDGATPTATPTATATPDVDWDPRLTQRGASLQAAAVSPGQGYWKLVQARWYDEQESGNRQHILVDTLDENGQRAADIPVRVYWEGGDATVTTEAKPGEEYAANFSLFYPAPFYNAAPNDGSPADAMLGMGLGSVEKPNDNIRASYGLTWRWTIAAQPTPTPSATPTPMATTEGTHTATGTATPTGTPTPTVVPFLFNRAELVNCQPNAGVTYVEGTLRLDNQPANGYRVVFSYEADGPLATNPVISGPHEGYLGWNPGYYSHLLQTNSPREGDWYFWVMDGAGLRVSALGFVHTHGTAGTGQCQQATIDFHSE